MKKWVSNLLSWLLLIESCFMPIAAFSGEVKLTPYNHGSEKVSRKICSEEVAAVIESDAPSRPFVPCNSKKSEDKDSENDGENDNSNTADKLTSRFLEQLVKINMLESPTGGDGNRVKDQCIPGTTQEVNTFPKAEAFCKFTRVIYSNYLYGNVNHIQEVDDKVKSPKPSCYNSQLMGTDCWYEDKETNQRRLITRSKMNQIETSWEDTLPLMPYLRYKNLMADKDEDEKFYINYKNIKVTDRLKHVESAYNLFKSLMLDDEIDVKEKILILGLYENIIFTPISSIRYIFHNEDYTTARLATNFVEKYKPFILNSDLEGEDNPGPMFIDQLKNMAPGKFVFEKSDENLYFSYSDAWKGELATASFIYSSSANNYLRAARYAQLLTMEQRSKEYMKMGHIERPITIDRSCNEPRVGYLKKKIELSEEDKETSDAFINHFLISQGMAPSDYISPVLKSIVSDEQRDAIERLEFESDQWFERKLYGVHFFPNEATIVSAAPFEDYSIAQLGLRAKDRLHLMPGIADERHFSKIRPFYLAKWSDLLEKGRPIYEQRLIPVEAEALLSREEKVSESQAMCVIDTEYDPTAAEIELPRNASYYQVQSYFNQRKKDKLDSLNYKEYEEILLFLSLVDRFKETDTYFVPVAKEKNEDSEEVEYDWVKSSTILINDEEVDVQGLNHYIIGLMAKEGETDWEDIIPTNVSTQLEKNTITFPMPKIHSTERWKRWGVNVVINYLSSYKENPMSDEEKDANGNIQYALVNACDQSHYSHPICKSERSKRWSTFKVAQDAIAILETLRDLSEYLPATPMADIEYKKIFRFIQSLWPMIIQHEMFDPIIKRNLAEIYRVNEYDYIMAQARTNPWLMLRLSFLIFKDKNLDKRERFKSTLDKLADSAKLNVAVLPNHANKLLDKDQLESFWKKIIREFDTNSQFLFNNTDDYRQNYFSKFRKLEQVNLLSKAGKAKATEIVGKIPSANLSTDDEDYKLQIEKLMEIYDLPGEENDNLRASKIDEFFSRFYNERSSSISYDVDMLKKHMLRINHQLKLPYYNSVLEDTSSGRLQEIKDKSNSLCNYKIEDRDDFKSTVRMTRQGADALVEAGIPVPELAKEKLDWWSGNDKANLIYALGAGGLVIIAGILTGGGFLIAAAIVGIVAVPTTGMAIKTIVDVVSRAKKDSRQIQEMYDIGYSTEQDISDSDRSWLWVGMEIFFAIPLIGTIGRSIQGLTRLGMATAKGVIKNATKEMTKAQAKEYTRQYSKMIVHKVELQAAGKFTETLKKVGFKQVIRRYFFGEGFDESLTLAKVNKNTVDLIASRFSNKPARMAGYFKDYVKDGFIWKSKLFRSVRNYNRIKVWKAKAKAAGTKMPLLKRAWAGMWEKSSQNLARSENLLLKTIDDLEKLTTEAQFQKYLANNIDDLEKLISKMPMLKKNLPALLLLGAPGAARLRVPLLQHTPMRNIGTTHYLRRLMSSRELVLFRMQMNSSAKRLGLKNSEQLHHGWDFFLQYREAMKKAILRSSGAESNSLAASAENGDRLFAQRIYDSFKRRGLEDSVKELGVDGIALELRTGSPTGRLLFSQTPIEDFNNFRFVEGHFSRIIKEQRDYANLDEFLEMMTSYKFLAAGKYPKLLELF